MAFRTASSFFEQRLWGHFGPEMDASPRNGSGAKQNVLSIKVSVTAFWVLLKAVAAISKRLFPRNSSASPTAARLALLKETYCLNGRYSAGSLK